MPCAARCAALLVYQKTWGLPPETVNVWRQVEKQGCKTASYHLDLYVGLRRQTQIGSDPFWQTGTVFTADGDPGTTAHLAAQGIDHRWLPAAICAEEAAREGNLRAEYDHDVVFVGSHRSYHPEWPWRKQLVSLLKARYGERLGLYGHGEPIRGQDLTDLYHTARVVVGDTLALEGHKNYWSDRYYETVGRGGFLIAPFVPGLEQHFTDREHLRYFCAGDFDRLTALIDRALERPQDARRIGIDGRAHVRAHHTYTNRVQEMLAALDLV